MLQHRQAIKAGDVCAVCDEHILASDAEEDVRNKDYVKFNVVEALSGSITQAAQFSANRSARNARIVATSQHIFQYDYLCGIISVIARKDSRTIAQLNKRPPANTFIATSCASQLHDGMFFYAYGSNSTEEGNTSNLLSSVYAVLAGEDSAVMSLAMHTEYKNSGFTEKNPGRIVSLHCYPSKPFLFVVFSKGTVQVWSYAKCHQYLQQELGGQTHNSVSYGGTNEGGNNDGAEDDASDAGGPDDASEHGGTNSVLSGSHGHGPGGSVRSGTGSVKVSSRGAFAGLGPSNKQIQAKLLKAVATFAIPSHKQLMRLDADLETLVTAPSSFRLDARGRFAAVVWSDRVVCVYDIYTLLMLHMLQKPLNTNSRGGAASASRNETVNVVQLSIFGAFPCRALPSPNGVEYSFGPVAFHPTAQVLLVTVLRHRQVPRVELTSTIAYRSNQGGSAHSSVGVDTAPTTVMPMSSLLYAVSLAVHQPILSAIGSYDLGNDINLKNLGGGITAGGAGNSVNWRPRSIDCTPHSGVIAVTLQTVNVNNHRKDVYSAGSPARDSAVPIGDIHSDPSPSTLSAMLNAEDMQDLDLTYNPNNTTSAEGAASSFNPHTESSSSLIQEIGNSHVMLLYSFSAAWLRTMGLVTSTVPLLSPLPVAPDVYLFGEGVLSSKSVYTLRDSSSSNSSGVTAGAISTETSGQSTTLSVRNFSLSEASAAPVNSTAASSAAVGQVTDQYPLLLALRTAFDGADEGLSVNSIAVGYHLFRTHWVHPAVANNNLNNNTGAGNAAPTTDGLEGSSASHIGMLPALLTVPLLEASQRNSSEWITLSAEDQLALSGWDNDAETAGAHVVHTFCPTRLVTKESIGLSSLQHLLCNKSAVVSPALGSFDAILIGTVRRAVASSTLYSVGESADINNISTARLLPCVCYLKYDSASGFSVAYSKHRDAAYWTRNNNTTSTVVVNTISDLNTIVDQQNAQAVGVLALSHGGLQVQHLVAQQAVPVTTGGIASSAFDDNDLFAEPASNTTEENSKTKVNQKLVSVSATYALGAEMSALWTSPAGAPDIVVFASPSPCVASTGANGSAYRQSLHATCSNPGVSDFGAVGVEKQHGRGHVMVLGPQEEVLDVQWQPMPSALGAKQSPGNNSINSSVQALQQVWLLNHNEPLLAVRTTHRVFICTHTFRVLNSVTYCESSTKASAPATGAEASTTLFLQRLLSSARSAQPSAPAQAPAVSPSILRDAVLSVSWIGAALSYTCESGAMYYLLPGQCVGGADAQTRRLGAASSPLYRAAGLRVPSLRRANGSEGHTNTAQGSEMSSGLLCSLPRNISTSIPASHRVVAVLSDRMLVSYLRRDDAYHSVTTLPQLAFTQRPFNPLEPLVLGLMALHYLRSPQQARRLPVVYAQDSITTLLGYYVSPKRDPSAGAAGGARPTAQCSNKLTLALSQYQPLVPVGMETPSIHKGSITNLSVAETPPTASNSAGLLAAAVAGMTVEQTRGSASSREFPVARWIASGFKFFTALQGRMVKHAALEQLSSRAELQELLLEQDAYGGSAVPHMHRPLSAQLSASAMLFHLQASVHARVLSHGLNSTTTTMVKDLSQLESAIARRLLDIGGDYASLSALLLAEGQRTKDASLTDEAQTLLDTVVSSLDRAAYIALYARCRALHRDWSTATVAAAVHYVLQGRFSLSALGASSRLKHLTSGSNRAEITELRNLSTSQLSQWETQLREHAARSGAQQGPPVVPCGSAAAASLTLPVMGPRCGGLLAMDLLEDFMGINLQLELSSMSAADLFNTPGSSDGHLDSGSSGAVGANGMYLGQPLPSSWVDGVGSGSKEHELVVAYYRFSDVAYQGEEGFHCSALSPFSTRLVFLDLSRFEGPGLELYSHSASAFKVDLSVSPVDPGEKHENVKSLCDVMYCPQEPAKHSESDFTASDAFSASNSQSIEQRGLRCPVLRGSQLDIGLFHEDSHRAKMTLEITVCFDEALANSTGNDATPSTQGGTKTHILAQRLANAGHTDNKAVLWTLYVSAEGEVCFVFGNVGAVGATVLKSAADAVTLPARQTSAVAGIAEQNNNMSSANWTHIALIIDSSKATVSHNNGQLTQTNAAVTLCVKGDSFDAKIAPPSISDAHLLHTTLLVGPDLSAGWRLTELRVWADSRSLNDIESMRENYLVMAMKRKRLQLRVKGTKKMFTAYRDIEIPTTACAALKAPTASQDQKNADEGADTTPTNAATTGAVKPLASLSSKTLSAAPLSTKPLKPLKALEKIDSSISSGTAAAGVDSASSGDTATPATAPAAAAAPVMSARERRMSMLKGGVSAPAPALKEGALAPKLSKVNASLEADSAQGDAVTSSSAAPALPSPSVSFAAFDAFPEPTKPVDVAVPVAAKESHPVAPTSPLRSPAVSASNSPLPLKSGTSFSFGSATGASTATFVHRKSLSELSGASPASNAGDNLWEKFTSAKPLALPQFWLQSHVPLAAAGGVSTSQRGIQAFSLVGSTEPATLTPCSSLSAEVRHAAESVIAAPVPSTSSATAASRAFRVAVLAKQVISVYSTALETSHAAELVAQVSLATVKLLFWTFISPDIIFLVTPSAGFTLKVAGGAPGAAGTVLNPKPAKIFDRVDVRDKNNWKSRTVLDLQVCADGWTLLLTCDTSAAVDREVAGGGEGCRLLTLYHARSGRSVSFAAAGGCFRFGVAQVLIVHEEANISDKDASLSVTVVDLSDIVKYWEAEGIAAVAPGVNNPALAHYKEPLLPTSLPATLHAQWHLPLVSVDKHAPALSPAFTAESGTQVDVVAAACLDQTSDPHLPALRVVSRTEGAVIDVSLKAFSKALSSPGGVPQQSTQSPASELSHKPNSPCALSNALPSCPVHVWSIGKLVYVLTERGVLHQCGVGAAVPQYVGAAQVPLPSVKSVPKVDVLPPIVKQKEEEFAPTVAPVATSAATTSPASTTSPPPAIDVTSIAAPRSSSPKPVVRNWTDNPGFGLKKSLASSVSPTNSVQSTSDAEAVVSPNAEVGSESAAIAQQAVPVVSAEGSNEAPVVFHIDNSAIADDTAGPAISANEQIASASSPGEVSGLHTEKEEDCVDDTTKPSIECADADADAEAIVKSEVSEGVVPYSPVPAALADHTLQEKTNSTPADTRTTVGASLEVTELSKDTQESEEAETKAEVATEAEGGCAIEEKSHAEPVSEPNGNASDVSSVVSLEMDSSSDKEA